MSKHYEESSLPYGPVLVLQRNRSLRPAYYDDDDEYGKAIVYYAGWNDGYSMVDPAKVFPCPAGIWEVVKAQICPEMRARPDVAEVMGIHLETSEKP